MIPKKTAAKQPTRSVHSQSSRMLSGAVRATLQVLQPDESWRVKKSKEKNKGKKH